tara:strand:- start:12 stop:680 length:669 start_codon:yes stop_codon:yes gene_type:complete
MPEFKESEGFKLRSGNTTNFKSMGSSPAKQRLNKGGEGQDQDKIFKNGEHVGDYVNGKKVMHKDVDDGKGPKKGDFMKQFKKVTPKMTETKAAEPESYGAGHKKVMKDGHVNPTQKKKIADEKARYNALSPEQKKAEQNAANDKADKFHKRGKYAVKKKSPNKQKKSWVDPKTGLNQLEKAVISNPLPSETTRMMLAEYYRQSASKKVAKKVVKKAVKKKKK